MSRSKGARKERGKPHGENGDVSHAVLTESLEQNVTQIQEMFHNNETLVTRRIENLSDHDIRCCILYTDGMVDNVVVNENIVRPLQKAVLKKSRGNLLGLLENSVLQANDVKRTHSLDDITQAIVYGDSVLFADGYAEALILNSKGFRIRGISEPESEKVLEGPREGFTESLLVNLSMLRRRVRTQDLKMEYKTFGTRTKTKGCICYIDGIVKQSILDELNRRLDLFDLDGALDASYIHELIQDSPHSPFPTVGRTERPDVVTGKLLEGRIAIFLDGSPVILTVPFLFIENFQSGEDYYQDFYYGTFSRLLRILGFFITIALPAIYTALVTFHHEMLPNAMLISLQTARHSVPFPTIVEAVGMIMIFQIVAETGIRMPTGIGQALSIVGALVIGQAAVEAKIVSAPMVIIVALTGITGLTIPKLKTANISLRFFLLFLSGLFGLYGFMLGLLMIVVHLLSIQCFGVSYMPYVTTHDFQKIKDIAIRAPWWKMIRRPRGVTDNQIRTTSDGKPKV